MGVNEPAIAPVGETRSDLKIAWRISEVLNRLEPGSSRFPIRGSEKDTLLQEIGPEMQKILGINGPEELLKHPYRAVFPRLSWGDHRFSTPSGKFEFFSERALEEGLPALPVYKPALEPPDDTPLRLITPHHQSGINSQVTGEPQKDDYELHLAPELAAKYGLSDGDRAELYNEQGSLNVNVQIEESLENNLLVIYQTQTGASVPPLNKLLTSHLTDMGRSATGAPGLALNETFVNLRKLRWS